MKILHFEAGRHLYGGARQVGYLIDGLAARGIDNALVCARGQALAAHVSARVIEIPIGGDIDIALSGRLTRIARDVEPDILHVHSRRGADTFGGRAARSIGLPAILTRRVQSAEPAPWLKFKCRPYRAVAAISSAVRDELAAAGVERERAHLIPSAVDTALFRPEAEARERVMTRYGLPADALILGSAAQLIRRKGHGSMLTLASKLVVAEPRVRLLLFGEGPERARLERQTARLGLTGHVVFAGFTSEWPALVAGLDVFVHAARREGLGAAVLEAMSAGIAVVASAAGGIVDAIDDGVDGRLVPADATDDWYRAMLDVLRDADQRQRLGNAARRKVRAHFTIDGMTDRYLALYRQVLGDAAG